MRRIPSAYLFVFFAIVGLLVSALLSTPSLRYGAFITIIAAAIAVALVVKAPRAVRAFTSMVRELMSSFDMWHLMWVGVFASTLIFRVRDTRQIAENAVDAWAIYRIVLMSIVGLLLAAHLALQKFHPANIVRGITGWYIAFGLFCIASTAWSVFPAWTLYKSGEYMVDVLLIAAIVVVMRSDWEFKSFFDLTYALYALLLVSVWAGAVIAPSQALQHSRGLIPVQLFGVLPAVTTNSVGEYGAILAMVSAVRFLTLKKRKPEHRTVYLFGILLGAASLIMSQTRSAIAGLVAGVLVVAFVAAPRVAAIWTAILSAVGVVSAGTTLLVLHFLQRGQSTQMIETATGRVQWWQVGWQTFLAHPILGLGSQAAARFAVLAKINAITSNIHNSFLETMIGTGIVGLVLLLTVVIWTVAALIRSLRRTNKQPWSTRRMLLMEATGIAVLLTVRAALSGVLVLHAPMFFLLVVGYAEFVRRRSVSPAVEVVRPSPAGAWAKPVLSSSRVSGTFSRG